MSAEINKIADKLAVIGKDLGTTDIGSMLYICRMGVMPNGVFTNNVTVSLDLGEAAQVTAQEKRTAAYFIAQQNEADLAKAVAVVRQLDEQSTAAHPSELCLPQFLLRDRSGHTPDDTAVMRQWNRIELSNNKGAYRTKAADRMEGLAIIAEMEKAGFPSGILRVTDRSSAGMVVRALTEHTLNDGGTQELARIGALITKIKIPGEVHCIAAASAPSSAHPDQTPGMNHLHQNARKV